MREKGRLIPFQINGKVKGFVTYYIGNGNRYVDKDSWAVLDDEPTTGTMCYIDQLITDKEKINHRYSFDCFRLFVDFIKRQYPQVGNIRWNRFKRGKVNVFCTKI